MHKGKYSWQCFQLRIVLIFIQWNFFSIDLVFKQNARWANMKGSTNFSDLILESHVTWKLDLVGFSKPRA